MFRLLRFPCGGLHAFFKFTIHLFFLFTLDIIGCFEDDGFENIDIYASPMTRYKGPAYTTQYGYRVVEIDENDTSTYETRVKRLYGVFDFDYIRTAEENGDKYSKRIAFELAVKGKVQEIFLNLWQSAVELFTDRTVTYPD